MDHDRRLIVVNHVSQNPNDQQELQPALDHLNPLPQALGQVDHLLGDHGYGSEANVKACEQGGITPLLATGRAGHHPTLEERWAAPGETPATADPVARMEYRWQTPEGQALYAKRQSTVEPVFGIIQTVANTDARFVPCTAADLESMLFHRPTVQLPACQNAYRRLFSLRSSNKDYQTKF